MTRRTYSELRLLPSFEDRFRYLQLNGSVGVDTFGFDRYLNQKFYQSVAWKQARRDVIIRDQGCDLGFPGHEIFGRILIHHMNPMNELDITSNNPDIVNPEYLICVTPTTHNAIHYGNELLLPQEPIERSPGDTKLW